MGSAGSYAPLATAIGPVLVAWNDHGVCVVAPGADAAELEAWFAARFGRSVAAVDRVPGALLREPVPVDWRGLPALDRAVLGAIRLIPRGQTWSYGEVARRISRPGAARAVGGALGRNRCPVLVPCHRVIAGDGSIGGFGLGLEAKRALLAAEGVVFARTEDQLGLWADRPSASGRV